MEFEKILFEVGLFEKGINGYTDTLGETVDHTARIIPLIQASIAMGGMTAVEGFQKVKEAIMMELIALNEIEKKMIEVSNSQETES